MNARAKVRARPNLKVVPMKREPDPDIVELLGEIYQMVQGGMIDRIAIAAVARDGGAITAVIGEDLTLLGATECLASRMKSAALNTGI